MSDKVEKLSNFESYMALTEHYGMERNCWWGASVLKLLVSL